MRKTSFDLRPILQKLEVAVKGAVTSGITGSYRSVFKGHGLEFESYRPYTPDDDASLIDWKASKRGDVILVKQFIEERNLSIFILIDVSSSMLYGSSQGRLKIEYASMIASSLCYATLAAEDSVGYGFFSSELVGYKIPEKGMAQFYRMTHDLLTGDVFGGHAQLATVLEKVNGILHEASIVIILSDFINCGPGWEEPLKRISHKHDVIAFAVHDVFDHTLPNDDAYLLLESPQGKGQIVVHAENARKTFEQKAAAFDKSLKETFLQSGSDYLHLSTNEPFVYPILQFFERRRSQWR